MRIGPYRCLLTGDDADGQLVDGAAEVDGDEANWQLGREPRAGVGTEKPMFEAPTFPRNLPHIWDTQYGRLAARTPVIIGEWGGHLMGDEMVWAEAFLAYMNAVGIGSFFCERHALRESSLRTHPRARHAASPLPLSARAARAL